MQEVFTLRLFKPVDLLRVMEINQICLPENYNAPFFMKIYERFPKTFIVAEEGGKIIGYTLCRIESGLPDLKLLGIIKKGHVISIAVLPEHQRKGVGRALILKAIKGMAVYKAKECYLEVRVSNKSAINLYRKMGFEIKKEVKNYYVDGESAYKMSRTLPNFSL